MCFLAKQFHCAAAWRSGRDTGLKDRPVPFVVIPNALIDKQGFSLSVRMKHNQALQPRAGVVGE